MDIDQIEQEVGAMQLSDSFFPAGLYATSNGLEFLFSKNQISGADDLAGLIKTSILQQLGPTDCTALAHVFDKTGDDFDRVLEADGIVFATKMVKEIRDASVRSGIQTVRCVAEFADDDTLKRYQKCILEKKASGVFPVAFAVCCCALGIKKEKGMAMMLYGHTVAVVGAALRLGLIEHFEGQRVIHKIKPVIARTVTEYSAKSLKELWQFAPQMDIVQMSHEKMDSKMFIT